MRRRARPSVATAALATAVLALAGGAAIGAPVTAAAATSTPTAATAPGAHAASSAVTYRQQANAACSSDRASLIALAGETRRKHLDAAEVIPRVEAINTRFLKTVHELQPPPSLASAHRRWLEDIGQVPGRRVAADEQALGLKVCVRLAHEKPPRIDA